ncbi:MAG: tetratricopeptide repeat protein [Fimbriimonadales bacterium]|nr:tetratricopeptide repeat protein [Fimbriimonadales bacterium]
MICPKCFAEIPETGAFCMECGSRLKDDTLDPLYAEGSDREIYPELARANLLRMQGKYEEAIDVCRRIMGRFPSNETVHALLGDIYADQGKLEDAIQWYELLVELAPSNVHYSAKLHNLRAMYAAQIAPPPPVALPEPEAKPAKPKALAYGLFGLLALILIAAAFVAGARMNAARESAAQPARNAQASLSPAPTSEPVRVPPPPTAEPSFSPAPSPAPMAGFAGMSAAEQNLAQKLSQRFNGAPVWCAFDPATNRWQARVRIQSGVLSKPRVLQEAIALARAFYEQYPNAPSLSVAVIAPSPNGDDVLVFSGEIAPQLAAFDPTQLGAEQAEAILQRLQAWWNPTIQFQG